MPTMSAHRSVIPTVNTTTVVSRWGSKSRGNERQLGETGTDHLHAYGGQQQPDHSARQRDQRTLSGGLPQDA